jgi:hypothetical protein
MERRGRVINWHERGVESGKEIKEGGILAGIPAA